MEQWTPESWRARPVRQQPPWDDPEKMEKILSILRRRLPLVFSGEVDLLKEKLGKAAQGEMFLLQGGDCAERFFPTIEEVENKLKVLLQMNMVLMYAGAKPVIKVGRFAGQYAKPRSSATETIDGVEMPSYFGDIVNKPEPDTEARQPNPKKLLDAYNYSAATLNIIRGLSSGGFADLHKVHTWNMEFIKHSPAGQHYEEIASGIAKSLDFMQACGIESPETVSTSFFTSHEALILEYEEALTRQDNEAFYDLSAHMLWVGERTRGPEDAHVEFLRGIANPVGVKIGPDTEPATLLTLLERLNPNNEWGKVTVITRMGQQRISEVLPPLIEAVESAGKRVLWSCDPMHGNIQKTGSGYKTRDFANILNELKHFFAIHREMGTIAGGVHLELTGDNVTECTGGAERISESTLEANYKTACDPRLNARQAIEMAFLIAGELQ